MSTADSYRIRTLIVTEALDGGILSSLANSCNGLDPAEFQVTLVYSRRPSTPPDEYLRRVYRPEVELLHIQGQRSINPLSDLKLAFAYWQLFGKERADIIHLHSSKAGFAGRLAARLAGCRTVLYSPRGYAFLRSDVGRGTSTLFYWLEKVAAWFGGYTVAVSRTEAWWAQRVTGRERTILIENAIDASAIKQQVAARPCSEPHPLTIATVGRLSAQKNPALFLKIAGRLLAGTPAVRFLWIGGGELEDWFRAHANQLGISDRVTCTGWLKREEVWATLSHQADIYVQTSLWEGMPLTVLEAMALGKPVVVSDCVGNRDVVDQGMNGYVAGDEDEMVHYLQLLVADPEARARQGSVGRAMVDERFSVSRLASELSSLYRRLSGTAPRASAR